MQLIALAMALLLEVFAFVGFAGLSFFLPYGETVRAVVLILLLALLTAFWAVFMAPKSKRKISGTPYFVAKSVVFVLGAIGLTNFWWFGYSVIFLALFVADEFILAKSKPGN